MNNVKGYVGVLIFCGVIITAYWAYMSEIILYADTPWAWFMIILGGIAIHLAPIGLSLYYLNGFGVIDYKSWLRNRKLKKKKK